MKIRKAVLADIGEIEKIEKASFKDAWGSPGIKAEFAKAFSEFFIAEHAGAAGFLLVYKIKDEAEIVRLAVLGEYRRQGIATALLESALSDFCGNVYLDVRKNNAPARALYESAGFLQYAVRKDYYNNPPDDALLMKKQCCHTRAR
ncbi:MAG: ribosomal protein S18-alanine N-acetyltransferase [Clostridiales bacterium]|nr:ribosomal protein S18-alanine N-acetyltransferase [Clostridiales bacterium]